MKSVHSFGMVILEIAKVSVSDAGSYSCTATNAFGTASSGMILNCVEMGRSGNVPKFTSQLSVREKMQINRL